MDSYGWLMSQTIASVGGFARPQRKHEEARVPEHQSLLTLSFISVTASFKEGVSKLFRANLQLI